MKIAVITPSFSTPYNWLKRCHESVLSQTIEAAHFIVFDDINDPNIERARDLQAKLICLEGPHGDYGDTPRAIGSISAIRQGFDAVAWLDADNWYENKHLETLADTMRREGVSVSFSTRKLFTLDEKLMGTCPEMQQGTFVDTNCYLVSRSEPGLISLWWLMDPASHKVGDRVIYQYIKSRDIKTASSKLDTLCYRSAFKAHYRHFGIEEPAGLKDSFQFRVARQS